MALINRTLGAFNNDTARASFTYDDVTRLIQSVTLVNDGVKGTLTVTGRDQATQSVVFGPVSRAFGTGSFTQSITSLNLLMVPVVGSKGGTALQPPVSLQLSWGA